METQVCSSIRDALLSFLGAELEVSTFEDQCIITLPLKTLDDRFLDVYVEPRIGDYVVVHDGGRTALRVARSRHPPNRHEARPPAIDGEAIRRVV